MSDFRQKIVKQDVVNKLKYIYPENESEKRIRDYSNKKLAGIILIASLGIVSTLLIHILTPKDKGLIDSYTIQRNGYGQGDKNVTLHVESDELSYSEDINIKISGLEYTYEKLEELYSEAESIIDGIIFDGYESCNHVDGNMNFVQEIEGYPFKISYETDDPMLVHNDGSVDFDRLRKIDPENKGRVTAIAVMFKCQNYSQVHYIHARLYMKPMQFDEKATMLIEEAIIQNDESGRETEYIKLPAEVGGLKVRYFEKRGDYTLFALMCWLLVLMAYYSKMDSDIDKRYKNRIVQMNEDYSTLVNKFALYYNAGMPVKAIWNKICMDYEEKSNSCGEVRYVYEEMLSLYYGMIDGMSEISAYEKFSKRCGIQKYKVFSEYLIQAVTRGKSNMGITLSEESIRSFNERKMSAKEKSEIAGTKLLIPMFMMLLVVIIMIAYPAFSSFSY